MSVFIASVPVIADGAEEHFSASVFVLFAGLLEFSVVAVRQVCAEEQDDDAGQDVAEPAHVRHVLQCHQMAMANCALQLF